MDGKEKLLISKVFNCSSTGNWNNIAPSKIAEAHTLLNNIYSPVGYQFTYQINYYPCTGTSGTRNYATFDENLVVTAVTTEIGTNFQQLGRLVVVSGNPQISTLNGFFYFPGGSYSGIGFMNTLRVGTGFTTLPHVIFDYLIYRSLDMDLVFYILLQVFLKPTIVLVLKLLQVTIMVTFVLTQFQVIFIFLTFSCKKLGMCCYNLNNNLS